ncbi:hypothetical protein EGM70_20495 [Enterobacteriaceae bacterium 89]|nr:hypothetical protein [Enterobacteriaceae bacterium 89]
MNIVENVIVVLNYFIRFRFAVIALLACVLSLIFIPFLTPIISPYIEPQLQAATEHYKLVMLIFIIFFSFLCSVVFTNLIECLLGPLKMLNTIIKDKYNKHRDLKIDLAIAEHLQNNILDEFMKAQPHLSQEITEILRSFVTSNSLKFRRDSEDIKFLLKCNWIKKVASASSDFDVYELNNRIKESVDAFWNIEVEENMHFLISRDSDVLDKVTSAFTPMKTHPASEHLTNHEHQANEKLFNQIFFISIIIEKSIFIFRFKPRYKEYFEQYMEKTFMDSAFIQIKKHNI